MTKKRKNRRLFALVVLTISFFAFPLQAQQRENTDPGTGLLKDYAFRTSGEFAFYRDYTFNEPTWIGILFYDENTWAAQTFAPGTGRRIIAFFKTEVSNGKLVLTGQKNDSNLQEDVPFVNYLMQIFPFLYESRLAAEKSGKPVAGSDTRNGKLSRGILPPDVETDSESVLFGGECRIRLAPEIPLFNVLLVKNSSGKKLFEFEYGGIISEESSAGFFNFEPVPASAKEKLAEIKSGKQPRVDLTDAKITTVTPNFFLLGDNALVLITTGQPMEGNSSPAKFFAEMAKGTIISPPNSSFISIPGNFTVEGTKDEIVLSQIFYEKENNEIIRDMKLVQPDFNSKEYTCAVISGFESGFYANEEKLKTLSRDLIKSGPETNID